MMLKSLAPPIIPAAESDGLLSKNDLQHNVMVTLLVWPYSHEQDTYQLILNNRPVGPVKSLPSPVPDVGSNLTLMIDKDDLGQDGFYDVSYRVTNIAGGQFADSPVFTIRCDRTPPGGALMSSLFFAEGELNGNTLAFIPGYAGIETGDLIRTLCNGVAGPTHTVQADELTLRPIEIVFEKAFLQSLAADYVDIDYTVTDRAGNESIRSLPQTLALVS
jgi:hypothetical protein